MHRILFICHGNICRSTMAQFVMQDMVTKAGLADDFEIDSAATSTEEIGNPPHHGTRSVLAAHGISCGMHYARQVTPDDYRHFDHLIAMDYENLRGLARIFGTGEDEDSGRMQTSCGGRGRLASTSDQSSSITARSFGRATRIYPYDPEDKISLLMNWTGRSEEVADPWYTGNFDVTYQDVLTGCQALLAQLVDTTLHNSKMDDLDT